MLSIVCDYCGQKAALVKSSVIYGPTYPDFGLMWYCKDCQAWVGTHENSKDHKPLGRLANKELRTAKMQAHQAFDRLWRRKIIRDKCSKTKARKAGYAWLAAKLNIPISKCHIGMFSVEQCMQVVHVCSPFNKTNTPD